MLLGPRKETVKDMNRNSGSSTCLSRFAGDGLDGLSGTSSSSTTTLARFLVFNAVRVDKGLLVAKELLVAKRGVRVVNGDLVVVDLLGVAGVAGVPVVVDLVGVPGVVVVAGAAGAERAAGRLATARAALPASCAISARTFFVC